MIDRTQTFTLPGSVVLDSNGNGTVRFAPAGEDWEIVYNSVNVSTSVKQSISNTFTPFVGANYLRDGTRSGSSGDTSDNVYQLQDGTPIFFTWTGGDVGATATVTITYYKSVPAGRGFRAA
jgi:hypothetical protein